MEKQGLQAGKLKFYNWLDPGTKDTKISIESREMVLNHAKITLKNSRNILGWL